MHGKNIEKLMCEIKAVSCLNIQEKLMSQHFKTILMNINHKKESVQFFSTGAWDAPILSSMAVVLSLSKTVAL